MTRSFRARPLRQATFAAVAFFAAANVAVAADDDGVHAFLANIFGDAGRSPVVEAAAPVSTSVPPVRRRLASYRPLTIRPHRDRSTPRVVAAVGPRKPTTVSIYTDPTLRPGDAVMTADGIRIFSGATSWPYAKADFIPLGKARDVSHGTMTVLAGLDRLPRS